MSNCIYTINKGIGKSIEFRGLRAQYIWYFGALVVVLMILFATLYIAGAGIVICLGLTGALGALGGIKIFSLSRRYGEHGMMKAIARRQVPKVLRSYSRRFFQNLESKRYEKV
jgi:hypothetical protein